MSSISRREFIKSAAAGALGVAAMGITGIAASAEGIYTPGTYSATAKGMNDVTVTMTFDADSITDVIVDVSNETATIGALYGDELQAQLLAAQSAEIDGVSGATLTSSAVMKAAQRCIDLAKGVAAPTAEAVKAEYDVPPTLTKEEVEASCAELGKLEVSEVKEYEIVVVGAGAAGVPAACIAAEDGAKVALLQKEACVVSQGNCASCIIPGKSTEAGIQKWVHHTNALCDWRADTKQLEAYAKYSEPALFWYWNRAGLTDQTEYGDGSLVDDPEKFGEQLNDGNGTFAFKRTSAMFTGVWKDRQDTYDYGEDKCYYMSPWIGPKPKNVGNVLQTVLDNVLKENVALDVFYNTPGVQLVKEGDKVVGVIGKDEDGNYIQFNASKAVVLATGDYMNNKEMVARWCPDIYDFDKKQYHKTGDGHVMAIAAGARMENLGHTKMMHDFDSALMWEEPFLYVNMNGERFTNEYTGFVYMGNILKTQPTYKGKNLDEDHKDIGSKGWYCTVYDSSYMEWPDECFVEGKIPPAVMEKYIPGFVENPEGVFPELLDLHRCDTLEELAAELDVPVDTFLETVKHYNELCDQGFDSDFGKPAKYLHKIETAPFWADRRHIRVSSEDSGVKINENGQCLDAEGNVIDGLYCIGNLGGPFYGGNDYPFHQPGLSLGRCYTYGYIAAKHILGEL